MNMMALDLEMNQPSGRIIQVGCVVFNLDTGAIIERAKFYTFIGEALNPDIIQLTGVTEEHLKDAPILLDVYPKIVELYKKHECKLNLVTWGGGDSQELRTELYQQWELNKFQPGHENPPEWAFGRRWVDTKTLFQCYCLKENKKLQAGLAKAMIRVGLNFEGRKHDAEDDAYNTARLFIHLIKKMSKGVILK